MQETRLSWFLIPGSKNHSFRKLLTGLASAAFMAWKLIVASAIKIDANPPMANNHQLILMR